MRNAAMRYEGNTLQEALGKALGTWDQYGRKIDRRRVPALLVKQFEPTNLLGPALQEFLGPMRQNAVRNALSYLNSLYDPDNPDEIGYSE